MTSIAKNALGTLWQWCSVALAFVLILGVIHNFAAVMVLLWAGSMTFYLCWWTGDMLLTGWRRLTR